MVIVLIKLSVHELLPGDTENRLHFCHWVQVMVKFKYNFYGREHIFKTWSDK